MSTTLSASPYKNLARRNIGLAAGGGPWPVTGGARGQLRQGMKRASQLTRVRSL